MDHEEMEKFLSNLYQEGVNDAPKNISVCSITEKDIHDAISTIKGIGEKRMIEIDNAITKLFEERRT